MKFCQTLYEKGFITYMRTDSKNYSNSFIKSAHKYITSKYEDKYFNNDFLKKAEQEKDNTEKAHEAIRPTDISLEDLSNTFDSKERKVYKLIWQNTVESLMTKACYNSIESKITTFQHLFFVNVSQQIHFPGWKIVKKKYEESESCKEKEYNYLSLFINKTDYQVKYTKVTSTVHLEETKKHYSEAKLVQMMEEKGIGRPSTFASLVEKIQEREYIKKEDVEGKIIDCLNYELESGNSYVHLKEQLVKTVFGNEKGKLIVQPLGVIIIDFLEKHFQDLFNFQYTKQMEDALDSISQGIISKQEVCQKFHQQILLLKEIMRETRLTKESGSIKIDENHTFIIGKNGPVIKCTEGENVTFKPIKKGMDIYRVKESSIDKIVDSKKMELKQKRDGIELGEYQGESLLLKKGKYGLYASWGEKTKSLKKLGNRPIDNIRFEDVLEILEK
jgi:DNA topoisomerase-1